MPLKETDVPVVPVFPVGPVASVTPVTPVAKVLQVAGHGAIRAEPADNGTTLLKPYSVGEFAFYRCLFRGSEETQGAHIPPRIQELQSFVPSFFGLREEVEASVFQANTPLCAEHLQEPELESQSPTHAPKRPKVGDSALVERSDEIQWMRRFERIRRQLQELASTEQVDFGEDDSKHKTSEQARPSSRLYLCMENLMLPFERPCALDIKLGTQQYEPTSSVAKSSRHLQKAMRTTSASLGFRLSGMAGYDTHLQRSFVRRKNAHRSLQQSEIVAELLLFFHDGTQVRVNVLAAVVDAVSRIYDRFVRDQALLLIYSGSLLIAFDGEEAPKHDTAPSVTVRLIDFVHSLPSFGQRDQSLMFGMEGLLKALRDALVQADHHHEYIARTMHENDAEV